MMAEKGAATPDLPSSTPTSASVKPVASTKRRAAAAISSVATPASFMAPRTTNGAVEPGGTGTCQWVQGAGRCERCVRFKKGSAGAHSVNHLPPSAHAGHEGRLHGPSPAHGSADAPVHGRLWHRCGCRTPPPQWGTQFLRGPHAQSASRQPATTPVIAQQRSVGLSPEASAQHQGTQQPRACSEEKVWGDEVPVDVPSTATATAASSSARAAS